MDFFHLQDLVTEASSAVKFFAPFEGFTAPPLPGTLDAYLAYRRRAIEFIESRNRRIAAHLEVEQRTDSESQRAVRAILPREATPEQIALLESGVGEIRQRPLGAESPMGAVTPP